MFDQVVYFSQISSSATFAIDIYNKLQFDCYKNVWGESRKTGKNRKTGTGGKGNPGKDILAWQKYQFSRNLIFYIRMHINRQCNVYLSKMEIKIAIWLRFPVIQIQMEGALRQQQKSSSSNFNSDSITDSYISSLPIVLVVWKWRFE